MTDHQALDLYIQSVNTERRAIVCARDGGAFVEDFERRYKAWREHFSVALARGAALAKERQMDGDKPPGIGAFANGNAELLAMLPEDDRQRRCVELLQSLVIPR